MRHARSGLRTQPISTLSRALGDAGALLLAALVLPACVGPAIASASAEMVTSDAEAPAPTCNGSGPRWVGTDGFEGVCENPDTDCKCPAAPEGWSASRAFAFTPQGADAPARLPPQLAPYCLYVWTGDADPDVEALHGAIDDEIDGLAEDCVVVAAHGATKLEETVRPWLREQFRDATRGPAPLPLGSVAPASIEIAVLDSSPTDTSGALPTGNLAHGHVVGWVARDLACDQAFFGPGVCFGHVSTHLALPYVDDITVDRVGGGSYGTRLELAQQIVRAVDAWKLQAIARPRLVIPLAVGWDPAFGGATDTASRAVLDSIVHAACHGVLVAAAAGNDTGGPTPAQGPLLPAAWESQSAPDETQCLTLEGVTKLTDLFPNGYAYSVLPAGASTAPLLVSVAGVDYADQPISLTRPASATALAALAFQGAAGDPTRPLPEPYTGTSVAVAVAGGTAASVWAYDPSLTAPQIIDILGATAVPITTFAPDQCAGKACAVKRISPTAARAFPCAGATANARCPAPASSTSAAPSAPSAKLANPTWPASIQSLLVTEFASAPTAPGGIPVATSPRDVATSVDVPWWIYPQPLQPGCGVCVMTRTSGNLYVKISPSYPSSVRNVTVTLRTGTTRGTNLSVAGLMYPGDQQIVALGSSYGATTTAHVSWIVGTTGSAATEQITVN